MAAVTTPENTEGEAWEYFDDCPVCQAQKAAEEEGRNLSSEELRAAMKKAKDQGAVVGGPLLDENPPGSPRSG